MRRRFCSLIITQLIVIRLAAPAAKKTLAAPAKKTVATKKMPKAELIRFVAGKMEIPTKQSAAFFELLAGSSAWCNPA